MLNGKQRAGLRRLANTTPPIFQIGKGGISDNLVSQVDGALETRELVKIAILRTAQLDTRETCDELARRTGAEPVQAIGKRFVLYRESAENKRINLNNLP
ncbi:MAG: ribosome assembly RNA-binding protein YhbY [Clostridiales bacterium]|nr:ribosome assembly RNA-binding protein YhbY [Clostridiales bacterium]